MLSSENESTYNVGTSVDVKPNEEEVTEDRVNGLIKVWVCIHDKTFDEYNEELKILEVITQCLEGEKLNKHYSGKSIHVLQIKFTDYEHVPA
ncbi:8315_t:CDS:2 [Entrophospora sp. SA101]|nr:13979_t:CDS:2 [Entrophospora sp. SA101]CAJ0829524.1 8315_t:CDS:2 [Entrophospora sp. SA101]CAJ0880022.1 9503_t:CDS:2 [Entrophospora sp. SA101]